MENNEHLSQLENAFLRTLARRTKKSSYKVAKTEYLATLGEGLHITRKIPIGIGNLEMSALALCTTFALYR
jgi:hypothetical protein